MKCIVILSGGLDSTTVTFWAINQGTKVHAITFDYGQKASIEIQKAKKITEQLNIPHKVIDLSALKDIYTGVTSLIDETIPLTSNFSQPIIVPFRNGIFLAIAVAYASSNGIDTIYYGAQGSDELHYPDCRTEFIKAYQEAARLGTEQNMKIEAPFSKMKKSEIIRKGKNLGVPFKETWSCYNSGPLHCGICESCINRKKAFQEANIPDPTQYVQ